MIETNQGNTLLQGEHAPPLPTTRRVDVVVPIRLERASGPLFVSIAVEWKCNVTDRLHGVYDVDVVDAEAFAISMRSSDDDRTGESWLVIDESPTQISVLLLDQYGDDPDLACAVRDAAIAEAFPKH